MSIGYAGARGVRSLRGCLREPELVESLLRTADVLTRDKHYTAKEIELWRKHMAPVRHAPLALQQAALLNWREDMVEHGLADAEDKGWEEFVGLDFEPGVLGEGAS